MIIIITGLPTWSQLLFGSTTNTKLSYHEPAAIDGKRIVKPPKSVFEEGPGFLMEECSGRATYW